MRCEMCGRESRVWRVDFNKKDVLLCEKCQDKLNRFINFNFEKEMERKYSKKIF